MLILIKGGRVIDPGNIDGIMNILIKDGLIAEITADEPVIFGENIRIIEAAGLIITPGLIDMHVHLREPGHEYKETIETGCRAAVSGGFTSVCAMPNTNPVNDSKEVTHFILKQAEAAGYAHLYPVGAISQGLEGKFLSEFFDLKQAGVKAVSDDGFPVRSSLLMRRALEYAKGFGLLVISHCEEMELAKSGVMNEGEVATKLGLGGVPNAAESVAVMRDIALSELTGARLHIAHISTKESVNAIRDAKKRGAPVTAETAPHYFTLTHDAVYGYNTFAKMNPPLRSAEDRDAVREGLADGTIDVIATDHAPHSSIEKDVEFEFAANGIVGLETSLPLSIKLVKDGFLSMNELVKKMSKNPAKILGIENTLKPGAVADLTIIDPEYRSIVNKAKFKSMGRNTPFDGMEIRGSALFTIVKGEVVFEKERPLDDQLP